MSKGRAVGYVLYLVFVISTAAIAFTLGSNQLFEWIARIEAAL